MSSFTDRAKQYYNRFSSSSKSSKTVTSSYSRGSRHRCHTGNIQVFETNPLPGGRTIKVYGGGNTREGGWQEGLPNGEVPDLVVGPKKQVDAPDLIGFTDLDSFPSHFVAFKWRDHGAPSVPTSFWSDLTDKIIEDESIETVQTMCMGGHGRTGTSLALLAWEFRVRGYLSNEGDYWKDVAALVEWVRERYCDNAVESSAQDKYISCATGLEVGDVKPPKKHRGGRGYGYGWTSSSSKKSSNKGSSSKSSSTKKRKVSIAEIDDDLVQLFKQWGASFWINKDRTKLGLSWDEDGQHIEWYKTPQDLEDDLHQMAFGHFGEGAD